MPKVSTISYLTVTFTGIVNSNEQVIQQETDMTNDKTDTYFEKDWHHMY